MRFYDDSWSSKLNLGRQGRTESAAACVLNMDILFSVNWKNENVSFFQNANDILEPGARGDLRSAQENGLPKVDGRATTSQSHSGAYAPFVPQGQNNAFLIQKQ